MSNNIVIFAVSILYLTKVVPDQLVHFYEVAGNASAPYSKMMSLRAFVHSNGEDNFGQVVGFNMDITMNSAFKCIALILNLYILFGTDEIIDLVLNCIALEFVSEMDEQYIDSDWWDPGKRWLRAGCVELTIRKYIATSELQDEEQIIENFDLDAGDIKKLDQLRENGKSEFERFGFKNLRMAVHNSENFSDTRAEKNMRTVVRIVKDLKRPQATREFIKPKAQFGFTKKVTLPIKRFLGIKDNSHTAVFWKFYPYRTWQTWNQLLYCKVRQNMIGDDDDKKLGCDKYYMDYKTLCTPAKLKDIADNLCKACKRKGECCNDHCFRRALACRLTELAVEGYDKKEDGLTRMVSIIGKGVNDAVDNAKNAVGNLADSLDETAGRMSPSWSTDRNGTTVVESPIRRKETLGGKFARALSSKKKDRSGIDHNPYEDALTATCKEEYKHPKDFKNFDTFADCTPVEDFLKEVVNTFVLVTMYKSVKHAWRVNNKWRLLTLLFDWMLRWMVWFISLVVFPIVVVGVIGGLPFFCMDHEEVINAVVNTVQQ